MSKLNYRRKNQPQIRPGPNGTYMDAADAADEDHHGKAIGRAKWKRLTNRAARHVLAQEVAAETRESAPTRPRFGTGGYALPPDLQRPFRDDFSTELTLTLTFIINGEDIEVLVDPDAPLALARWAVLLESQNLSRPPEDWELRTADVGRIVPLGLSAKALGIRNGSKFYLTVQTGWGGSTAFMPKEVDAHAA